MLSLLTAPSVRGAAAPLHVLIDGRWQRLERAELLAAAQAAANALTSAGVKPGERVVIMGPTAIWTLAAIFATWYIGATTVLLPATRSRGQSAWADQHLGEQLATCAPAAVICSTETDAMFPATLGEARTGPPPFSILRPADLLRPQDRYAPAFWQDVNPAACAHLQFTSGTTGQSKAVMISHEQIVANAHAIGSAIGVKASDFVLSWLPLYHDMGFIGGLACSLVWDIPLWLIPTEAFSRNPALWLQSISDQRISLSPAPAFAYELMATHVPKKKLAELDLACWRYAWIGAEPVRGQVIEEFNHRFAVTGLLPTTLAPCYGLAESTLAVSLTAPGAGYRSTVPASASGAVVASGKPIEGIEVRIESAGNSPDGRILLKGKHVTQGYFGDPRAEAGDGWLDTGDRGFLHDGQLYVTGREKDIVFQGGINLHLHWVEDVVRRVLRSFDVDLNPKVAVLNYSEPLSTRESLACIFEARDRDQNRLDEIAMALRSAVLADLGVTLHVVHPVPRGSLPYTSSGKLIRSKCRGLVPC